MKSTFFLTLLAFIFISITPLFSQTTTVYEVMDVKNYNIDLGVESSEGEGTHPRLNYLIQIEGSPTPGKTINKIMLHFYQESDERIKFKPLYDPSTRTARAYFPTTEFDKFYEILKHKKNGLRASFRHTPNLQQMEVKLTVYGKVPMG